MIRAELIGIEQMSDDAGLHPQLVRRLVALGLIERRGGTATAPLFRRADAARLERAVRLRRDLGLNFAGAVLASDLLARIEELEARLRAWAPRTGRENTVIRWIRTS